MHTTPSALMGIAGRSCRLVKAPAIQNGIESAKVSAKYVQGDLFLGTAGFSPSPPIDSLSDRVCGLCIVLCLSETAFLDGAMPELRGTASHKRIKRLFAGKPKVFRIAGRQSRESIKESKVDALQILRQPIVKVSRKQNTKLFQIDSLADIRGYSSIFKRIDSCDSAE